MLEHERMQLSGLAGLWSDEAQQLRNDGKFDMAAAIESNAEDLRLWLGTQMDSRS